MESYEPLITGVLLPVATFLNVQSVTVPTWLTWPNDGPESHFIKPSSSYYRPPPIENGVYSQPAIVLVFSIASLFFGIVANIALFIRMLEKKIKWTTRIFIVGSICQGTISLLLVFIFLAITHISKDDKHSYHFTEGGVKVNYSTHLFFHLWLHVANCWTIGGASAISTQKPGLHLFGKEDYTLSAPVDFVNYYGSILFTDFGWNLFMD